MPELATKNVQTEVIEEFAVKKTEEDAEVNEIVEIQPTEQSMHEELQA